MAHNKFFSLSKQYAIPISIVVATKLFLLVLVWHQSIINPLSRAAQTGFFDAWNVWDAPHYLSLAQHGYQTVGDPANFIVFFPLFPFVVFLTQTVLLSSSLVASYIINSVFLIISGLLLYHLSLFDFSKKESVWIILSMFLFPTGFFFHAPYTESLFLMLTLLMFFFLRTKHFLLAMWCVGLATATRMTGLILIPPLLVELFGEQNYSMRKKFFLTAVALPLTLSGFVIYLGINWWYFGNPFHFIAVQQENWFTHFSPTLKGLISAWESISWRVGAEKLMLGYGQLLAFGIAVVGLIASIRKLRPSYSLYYAGVLYMSAGISFWLSIPRYILIIFPLFMIIGKLASRFFVFRLLWFPFSAALLYWCATVFIAWGPVF